MNIERGASYAENGNLFYVLFTTTHNGPYDDRGQHSTNVRRNTCTL